VARTLLISGVMQRSTTNRPRQLLPALLAFTAALTLFAPDYASADSPTAIRGASAAVLAIRNTAGIRIAPSTSVLQPAPKPASRGFVSEDLLNTATEVVNNGIRLGDGPTNGTFYVHFKPQGFGGVLSIRYRHRH